MMKESNQFKICVPVTGRTDEEIIMLMQKAKDSHADAVEWRVDCYDHVNVMERVIEMLKAIRSILDNKELIFTFRSVQEGGEKELPSADYLLLCKTAILTKLIDYIDVELLLGDTIVNSIVKQAHIGNTKVLMSNHDWDSTPRREIIENRLKVMFEKGADVAKVACMPRNQADVEELIKAGQKVKKEYDHIILISMGEMGKITRIQPALTGSCMTFASLSNKESAPGQYDVEELYNIINN